MQRVVDYIAAGDIFQANIAQRFSAPFQGSHPAAERALFAALAGASPAWYGAYMEFAADADGLRRTLASTSPELFLQVEPQGRVITRPIKGTRPAHVNPEELSQSEKDAAELVMIVDLMRNDLGRVCSYGSLRVDEARRVETHPTVHHGVATVSGQLHPAYDLVDLLQATLPGGSVTGAPKIRAMQIIDQIEPVRRGPYCGAMGWLTRNSACLNVAIRTLLLETRQGRGRVDFSVGGGIVSDSQPAAEYQETLDKAAVLFKALRGPASPLAAGVGDV